MKQEIVVIILQIASIVGTFVMLISAQIWFVVM